MPHGNDREIAGFGYLFPSYSTAEQTCWAFTLVWGSGGQAGRKFEFESRKIERREREGDKKGRRKRRSCSSGTAW